MQVQELRGNIRVHVRVRPCEGGSAASALHCEDGHRIACTALGATKVRTWAVRASSGSQRPLAQFICGVTVAMLHDWPLAMLIVTPLPPEESCLNFVLSWLGEQGICGAAVQAFEFDRVYGPESGQEAVFEDVAALTTSALDGYNVCIFAYGQTGARKLAPYSPSILRNRSAQEFDWSDLCMLRRLRKSAWRTELVLSLHAL